MFLSTLDISERWCRTSCKKLGTGSTISPDKRGKHSKVSPAQKSLAEDNVKEHVNTFARVPSHLCRSTTKVKYLDKRLTISKMYRLYLNWMKQAKPGQKTVSEKAYREIFNTKFNLSFHKPKKDQCKTCNVYDRCSPREKALLEDNYQKHRRENKKAAKDRKDVDKAYAKANSETVCFAIYDLQKVLQCPKCDTSDLYYSRKLNVYNFTIYDAIQFQGYCYVWDESEAKRGANEIASSVYDFIAMMVNKGINEFIFWSDNCNGQNKNKYLFAMYTHASAKFKVKISHRYLETGHTGNEADSMHSNIERQSRTRDIFVPEEWYDLMKETKVTGKPYIVKRNSRILDFHDLAEIHQTWSGHKNIKWKHLREVVVDPGYTGQLEVKEKLTDKERIVVVSKQSRRGRPINLAEHPLQLAYDKPIALKQAKLQDLWKLCNSLVIPSNKHDVYLKFENFPALTNSIILMAQHGEADEDDEDPNWAWNDENDIESNVDYEELLRKSAEDPIHKRDNVLETDSSAIDEPQSE